MSPPALTIPVSAYDHRQCPATALLQRVGDKWTPLLLSLLATRSLGYNELDRAVEGLSRRMLTRTLRTLERDGLVSRTVHGGRVTRVEYALTDLGHSLREPLLALGHWALTHDSALKAAQTAYDASRPRDL
jgi:DNA-binding HxlR family transcriptional regulator